MKDEYEYRDDPPSRNVMITRVEYEALLRDRALAEKVRGMEKGICLGRNLAGQWFYQQEGWNAPVSWLWSTPEEALGIEEVGNV